MGKTKKATAPVSTDVSQQQAEAQRLAVEQAAARADAERIAAEKEAAEKAEAERVAAEKAAAAYRAKATAFMRDFIDDVPHEASTQGGHYSFGLRDRWHGTKPGLLDGWYRLDEWAVRIHGGHPVTAVRRDNALFPRTVKFDLS